jgi:hypothetical protein
MTVQGHLAASGNLLSNPSCRVAQDVSGGKPVPVEGTALPLWGLEIDPERAKEDFRAYNARDGGQVRAFHDEHILVHRKEGGLLHMEMSGTAGTCAKCSLNLIQTTFIELYFENVASLTIFHLSSNFSCAAHVPGRALA